MIPIYSLFGMVSFSLTTPRMTCSAQCRSVAIFLHCRPGTADRAELAESET